MAQEIFVVDNSNKLVSKLNEVFEAEKEFRLKNIKDVGLEKALDGIPSLIIIDKENIEMNVVEMCKMIRMDDDNSITPIIVISKVARKQHKMSILKECVEYVLERPIDKDCIYYTIKNLLRLINTNRRISPLTGLPGNVQIHAEMKKRLLSKKTFAVLYFDLDNFKAYNDVYGFLKGDEIIKYTATTIVRNIHDVGAVENFVGHIGGDDFVAIVDNESYEEICQNIILEFDKGMSVYYTDADMARGYLEVPNRKGVMEQFPLTSLSIGVVVVDKGQYANILEIGEVGAQVKHLAKTALGSTYVINRRKFVEF